MKVKFTNNTKSKLWISDFCFVPGESIFEITEVQKKKIDDILKNNDVFKKAKADKKIDFAEVKEEQDNEEDSKNKK